MERQIKRKARAGSYESNDLLVEVEPHDTLEIIIKSVVADLFYDSIYGRVQDTLRACKLERGKVIVDDRGALDYAIRARVMAAVERGSADEL